MRDDFFVLKGALMACAGKLSQGKLRRMCTRRRLTCSADLSDRPGQFDCKFVIICKDVEKAQPENQFCCIARKRSY